MVVADLGCSSGPNTLLVVSEVLAAVANRCSERLAAAYVQLQFFLNDLPCNDFNLVFQSLELFKKLTVKEMGEAEVQNPSTTLPGCRVPSTPDSSLIVPSTSSTPRIASL
ncbi:hypothetical protein ABZP36_023775 [Zizania latifolia]